MKIVEKKCINNNASMMSDNYHCSLVKKSLDSVYMMNTTTAPSKTSQDSSKQDEPCKSALHRLNTARIALEMARTDYIFSRFDDVAEEERYFYWANQVRQLSRNYDDCMHSQHNEW